MPDHPAVAIVFVGLQVAGSRGRSLCDGAKQSKINWQSAPVAARVERIDSILARADAGEIMRRLSGLAQPPAMTYLV